MSDTKDDGQAPAKLSLPVAPREAGVGRAALAKTLVGHASPAPPEAAAWLHSLLFKQAAPEKAPPATPPAPVADPTPPTALVAEPTPPTAPVAEPTLPPTLVAEPTPPAPSVAAEAPAPAPDEAQAPALIAAPTPAPDEAPAPVEAPAPEPVVPAVVATSAPPSVAPVAHAAKASHLDPDALTAAGRRRVVLFALGPAAVLAATIGVLVHRSHSSAPAAQPASVADEAPASVAPPPAEPVAPPPAAPVAPPLAAPVAPQPAAPAQPPHLEIALDPSGSTAQAKPEEAAPNPVEVAAKPVEATSRPREKPTSKRVGGPSAYQRGNALLLAGDAAGAAAAFQEAVRLAPDDAGGYRGLGLAYEKQGKVPEAIDAFKRCLKLAKRTRDREIVARHLYQLTHPGE